MKLKNVSCKFSAAVLTMVATVAFGQDNGLTATVPFEFRVAGADYPAGRYKIARMHGTSSNSGNLQLSNLDTGKTVFVPTKVNIMEKVTSGKNARLIFHCAEGCALETLWSGTGSGFEFSVPPLTSSQKERHETIYLDPYKQ